MKHSVQPATLPALRVMALAAAFILVTGNHALAHDPGLSAASAIWTSQTLTIHLGMARSDVERLVALDADHDGKISQSEFQAAMPALQALARGAFQITVGGRSCAVNDAAIELGQDLQFKIQFHHVDVGALTIQSAILDKLPRGHRQFISLRDPNQAVLGQGMLDATHPLFTSQLARQSLSTAQPHSFKDFLMLGVEHIATGFDHLLFLFGLLIVGGSLRAALQIITSFTLAHSLTLALATLGLVNIPPRIIEPLIAASIIFVGVQNILRRGVEQRWLLTFAFGLIHGCGFASALRDLGIGAHGGNIVVPLVSFNLGVEAGQLAIAAVALPCIWKFHARSSALPALVPATSTLIALAGGYWFIERILL